MATRLPLEQRMTMSRGTTTELSSTMVDTPFVPKASVTKWNGEDVIVHCPFCGGEHLHTFRGYVPEDSIMSRPCSKSAGMALQYQFEFPFEEGKFVGFEIRKHWDVLKDKECIGKIGEKAYSGSRDDSENNRGGGRDEVGELTEAFSRAFNLTGYQKDEPPTQPLLDHVETKIRVAHLTDVDSVRLPVLEAINFATHDLLTGNTKRVEKFLNTSQDAPRLLRSQDDSGNTTLILASAEEHPYMLNLLLKYGADVDY